MSAAAGPAGDPVHSTSRSSRSTSAALEDEIDTELLLQLAAKRKATASDAAIQAQITTDATTVESRHVFQIAIVPERDRRSRARRPTLRSRRPRRRRPGLLADLKGGKSWEDVVKASGDATAAANNGDLLFLDKGSISPDKAFVDAIFALPTAPGYTDVVKGSDGTFRIGRLTEIAPEQVDPDFTKRIGDAGISLDAYKRVDSALVVRDVIQAQVIAEVVDAPSQAARGLGDRAREQQRPDRHRRRHPRQAHPLLAEQRSGHGQRSQGGRPGLGESEAGGGRRLREAARPAPPPSRPWRRPATTRVRARRTGSFPTSPRTTRPRPSIRRSRLPSSPRG